MAVGSLLSSSEEDDFLGVLELFSWSGDVGAEIIGDEDEVDDTTWPTLLTEEFLEVSIMGKTALLHEILGILELWAENPLKIEKKDQ